MNHETAIRTNLAKVYLLISKGEIDPERMELANSKMEQVLEILSGTAPLQVTKNEERG
jgi:hypothetical protein